MIALLQRVSKAHVMINDKNIASINQGLLVFIAIEHEDNEAQGKRLLQRILGYRIFADQQQKMNLSVQDIQGGLLLIPQFTLAADTTKGMRPSFTSAASPAQGEQLFSYFLTISKQAYQKVSHGCFGADMQVSLINDGPATFWLQVK